MKVPYRPTGFKKFILPPKYIVIHDTNCKFYSLPNYTIDDKKSIINKMRSDYFILYNETDLPFHFLIDKIQDDYEIIVGRSLRYICIYEDIRQELQNRTIHIGMTGNMNLIKPTQRFYQCLAYKILSPLLNRFGLPASNIFFHNEVSSNPNLKCPGSFFTKDILLSNVKKLLTN